MEQVEAEGAALLLNENNALPLENGANVSCFSNSSVSLIYGGTGSGNVDISKSSTLKGALTDAGFNVNETLWDFYTEEEGSEYERDPGQLFPHRNATAVDVPWDVYTDEVKDSVKQYGEVAFTFGYGLSYTDFEYSNMAVSYNQETDQFEVTVTVTNVGDTYSGKEVVQVYMQSPYTECDKENSVEKAAYYLTVADNAHVAVNNILAAKGYTPESTDNRMDAAGDATLTYLWTCDAKALLEERFQSLWNNMDVFSKVSVQVGGFGIEWGGICSISDKDLYTSGINVPLSIEDFGLFVKNRVVNTKEATDILDCSRQNIDDLIRRKKLKPLKTDAKNKLFYRKDIEQRRWE